MLPRPFLGVTLAALIAVGACGGDDDSGPSATPSLTATASEQARLTTTATPITDNSKSPQPEQTTDLRNAPAETAPGEVPTRRATSEGSPAVAPNDQESFIAQFAGQEVEQRECGYDPTTGSATCPGYGFYALDPPMTGQDITCAALVIAAKVSALFCSSIQPQTTVYYETQ